MRRRETFSAIAAFVLVPMLETACSSGDDDSCSSSNSCNGVGATTTNVSSHTHFVCVAMADLDNPPSGGQTYTTTNVQAHTHSITLSADQLTSIAGGGSVTVTTTLNAAHTHDVTLKK